MHRESGTIIVGWLTKIVVSLTLVGVLGFDLVSVAATRISAADDASHAARLGAEAYASSRGDVQAAYRAALAYAEEHNGAIDPKDFVVESDGTIRVKVVKTATTIVFYRAGPTKKWAHVVADGSGKDT